MDKFGRENHGLEQRLLETIAKPAVTESQETMHSCGGDMRS